MDHYFLKNAFLNSTFQDNFSDGELLELLIFLLCTTQDPTVVSKQLLIKFKNLEKTINADKDKLLAVEEIDDTITVVFLVSIN